VAFVEAARRVSTLFSLFLSSRGPGVDCLLVECGEVCQYYFSIFEIADYIGLLSPRQNVEGLKRQSFDSPYLLACRAAGWAKAGALARDRRWLERGSLAITRGDREGGAHGVTRSTQLRLSARRRW